ncbi:MAG: isoprenylcysteine carboxylmethyltransferase family protein [Atribacterota bacterium]|nr:isoprenylcysteine carboxylmethyltransferase family protein [Atribacterota bacterium]
MKTFFWTIVLSWLIVDLYVLFFKSRNPQQVVDRRSKFVVVACIASGVVLSLLPRDFRETWIRRENFTTLQEIGVFCMLAGVILRCISILTLGRHFTPDIALVENHRLIQKGIYRFVRHPSYTGEILAFGGTAFVFWHIPSSIFVFFLPLLGFLYRASLEERKLLELFGEEYREYMSKTRRFI